MNPERFTGANAAMLLIDHQIGTMGWVRSAPFDEIKRNTLVLAKAAKALNVPVILTSSMEEHVQGPLMTELQLILPEAFAARIKRVGVVDAMDDDNFASAVLATGRKNLIMAGITTDVCVVYPAITAVQQGYSVQVVVDAAAARRRTGLPSRSLNRPRLGVDEARMRGQGAPGLPGAVVA